MTWRSLGRNLLRVYPLLLTLACALLLVSLGVDRFDKSLSLMGFKRGLYLSIAVLSVVGLVIVWYSDRHSSLVPEARSFFNYLRGHNRWVWLTAASAGGILFVLTLGVTYFFEESSWTSSADGAFGSFVTGVAAVLGISRFFQDRVITEMCDLLDLLSDDLKKASRLGSGCSGVWFSYPGLGLGHYRALDRDGVDLPASEAEREAGLEADRAAWSKFEPALDGVMRDSRIPFTAFVWNASFLPRFFAHYEQKVHMSELSESRYRAGVEKEIRLHNLVVGRHNRNAKLYAVRPEALQVHAIVIHDTVYTIQTFGLPWYLSGNGEGRFVGGEPQFLSLIAQRKQSASLKQSVLSHFNLLAGVIRSQQLDGARLCDNAAQQPTADEFANAWSDVREYLQPPERTASNSGDTDSAK